MGLRALRRRELSADAARQHRDSEETSVCGPHCGDVDLFRSRDVKKNEESEKCSKGSKSLARGVADTKTVSLLENSLFRHVRVV